MPKPALHTVLRLVNLSIAACLLLFVGCDMPGSSESDSASLEGPVYTPGNGFKYFVTEREYDPESDDITSLIKQEFGSDAELGDWSVLAGLYADDKSGLVSFLDGVGMSEDDNAYVTRAGDQYWDGDRHYFIKRHNGDKGDNFLEHDNLHSNTLSLGSWFNSNPALVRFPE